MIAVRNLRVMTFNIHWGQGTDGLYNLRRIADVINRESPDVVCLQEVHRQTERFGEDQAQLLSEMTDMTMYFSKTMSGYPQDPDSCGEYGNLILSNIDGGEHVTHDFTRGTGWSISQEPRGAQALMFPNLTVVNTHLGCDITGTEQKVQASELVGFVSGLGCESVVVCGDMNSFPVTDASRHMRRMWTDAWETLKYGKTSYRHGCTMPSWVPFQRIDHVLYRGNLIPERIDVLDTTLECGNHPSDHLPVVADFTVGSEDEIL